MTDITIKDGYMYGGWRAPENLYRAFDGATSIHDDSVAKKVGMRGGTIPGTIHLSLFAPLMLEIFGQRWFEKGSLSMYYTFATTDKEEVRAVVKMPPEGVDNVQVEARVEMPSGQVVATGTVAVGEPKDLSYLQALELRNSNPEDLRILAGMKVGDALDKQNILISQDEASKGLPGITDHLDYYKGKSPWGNSILSPTAIYGTMALGSNTLKATEIKAVPFFGATEIQNVNGPVMVGTPYEASGKIACAGASSKTEYYWQDCLLKEKESGKVVASMRHMNRFMKAGSAVYSK
ncbi:MAG: hypothetical protein KGD58_11020 [Candidatus Lokiarchaeota archaeon]|nr:hypothetical protein [Candidatus Lokiarchaeota archaeon]